MSWLEDRQRELDEQEGLYLKLFDGKISKELQEVLDRSQARIDEERAALERANARVGTTKLIGYAGVDSGQILITDPCYLHDWSDDDAGSQDGNSGPLPYSYGGSCAATMSEDCGGPLVYKAGHQGAGVAVQSGWGDGSYPVYIEYGEEGRPGRVIIDFMGTMEEEA